MGDRRIDQLSDLKALAHPIRMRLIYALKAGGPMTASQLGETVGESPASVSYHLRQMARHGYAEEVSDVGTDKRQRWWRAPEGGFTWEREDFDGSPEGVDVQNAARQVLLAHQWARLRDYDEASWDDDWARSAFASDDLLSLTPQESREMQGELREVIDRWRTKSTRSRPGTRDRETVMLLMHGFPIRP